VDIHRVGRTPAGECYRSRLGALTRPAATFPELLIVFTDECSTYNAEIGLQTAAQAEINWMTDLAYWHSTIDQYGSPRHGLALLDLEATPGFYQTDDIAPFGVPRGIELFNVTRPPSASDIADIYEQVKKEGTPELITLLVDASGSMTRATIASSLDAFEEWLDNGGTFTPDPGNPLTPLGWQEMEFSGEDWLRRIASYIRSRE